MKNKSSSVLIKWIFLLFTTITMACEKVVKIEVNSAAGTPVVQANVTNLTGPYKVKLEYSTSYYNSNIFPPVTGAHITIYDNTGQSETLNEKEPGLYFTSAFKGVVGRTYNIQILSKGVIYESSTIMPNPVPIDSFLIVQRTGSGSLQQVGYSIVCKFTDPEGIGNFYRVVISSNDTAGLRGRTSRLISDKLTDGTQLATTFRTQLLLYDTVSIQLQCIPKSTYDFFNTLSNAQGDVGAGQFLSALPANPTNNISNKGLGYFSAYAVTTLSAIIK